VKARVKAAVPLVVNLDAFNPSEMTDEQKMHGSRDHAVVDMAMSTKTVFATYREGPQSGTLVRQISSSIVRSST
jgi:hypothetical protein